MSDSQRKLITSVSSIYSVVLSEALPSSKVQFLELQRIPAELIKILLAALKTNVLFLSESILKESLLLVDAIFSTHRFHHYLGTCTLNGNNEY